MQFAFRRDVAIGRFVPLDTPIHRLDPRTKLLGFAAILTILFQVNLLGVGALLVGLFVATRLAGVPGGRVVAVVKGLVWILLVTFLYHWLWEGPRRLGGWEAGAVSGLWMVGRLVGMMILAMLLTFTTEPIRLADGISRLFGFLERVRIPVRDLAMVLTLALRFLPTVLEEAQRIVTAQRARGARFEGGLLRRARLLIPLTVPLFAGCLHRADTLALAMDARGYSGRTRRTQLDPSRFSGSDAIVLAGLAIAVIAAFGVGRP